MVKSGRLFVCVFVSAVCGLVGPGNRGLDQDVVGGLRTVNSKMETYHRLKSDPEARDELASCLWF